MRVAAVSIDLDEISFYYQIHGLTAEPGGEGASAVYDIALDRLEALSTALSVPLTLFAIGGNLARPKSAARLRQAATRGHEIGNHTYGHPYRLTTLDRGAMEREVEEGARAIHNATGSRPRGFRAPGYTVSDDLLDHLRESGVRYDSSVFPCPAYFGAKVAAITAIRLRGRASHSMADTPNVLRAPTRPYRVGRPYWKRGDGLLELPIQVTRGLRLPFIGTSVTMAGPAGARALAGMVVGEPLVNLELHGIDVLDRHDGLEALVPYQPDVRVPHPRKVEALASAIETLRASGYAFLTLEEAASEAARWVA